MSEQSITIQSAEELHAVQHQPDATADCSTGVVYVHGWSGYCTGPHRIFVNTARRLATEGFHALRLDLRGRGDSEGGKDTTDLDAMIDDVLSACRYLREEGVRRVYVLGICSGGNAALGAASLDKSIDGLMLWSTPLFAPQKAGTEELRRRGSFAATYFRKLFRRETYTKLFAGKLNFRLILQILAGKRSGKQPSTVGSRNLKDSRRDVMTDLRGYPGRALFIYGSADDEAAGAPEFYRKYCEEQGIPAEFHTVQGANHSFYSLGWEREVIDATSDWLKTTEAERRLK